MEYLSRNIDVHLCDWAAQPSHKPLLLRGARQVGKSRAVKEFGKSFKYYIEVNFERQPELKSLFAKTHDVHAIASELELLYGTPVVPGETLVFLDEIQACPDALKCLWFFKEDYPDLHIVAAGSLLEFALKDITSYGVGRIRSMFMYPMSFDEFLRATGHDMWAQAIGQASPEHPLPDSVHAEIVRLFRTFLIVGGMPASVAAWVNTGSYQTSLQELQDIQQSHYDDFSKYAQRIPTQLLRNTLQSAIVQQGGKFVYSKVQGGYRTEKVKTALQMLCDAGLLRRVSHTAANGLPLGAEVNNKFIKYLYLDSGLLLRVLDLDLGGAREITTQVLAGSAEDLVNKGSLAELVAGWEMVKHSNPVTQHELYYWENLKNGATAEVDYITAHNMSILPIEVKAGTSGKMKSLRQFVEAKGLGHAIRTSLENFGRLQLQLNGKEVTIEICPIYALGQYMGR